MVRVGGGWVSLSDFLLKHDPCRGKQARKKNLHSMMVLFNFVFEFFDFDFFDFDFLILILFFLIFFVNFFR